MRAPALIALALLAGAPCSIAEEPAAGTIAVQLRVWQDESPVFASAAPAVARGAEAFFARYGVPVAITVLPPGDTGVEGPPLVCVLPEATYRRLTTDASHPRVDTRDYGTAYPGLGVAYIMDANEAYYGRRLTVAEMTHAWSAILAHEIAHLLGLPHAPADDPCNLLAASETPYLRDAHLTPAQVAVLRDAQSGSIVCCEQFR